MNLKNTLYFSVCLRIFVVIMGMGMIYFRCLKSENQATVVPIIPMIEASASGQLNKLKELWKKGESVNIKDNAANYRDPLGSYGNTPLGFAVWNGTYPANQPVIDFLLQHQAHVRSKNDAGQAPHLWVTKIDYKELRMKILGKLIKFGADINDKDNKSYTLLEKIVENYDLIGVDIILDWWGKLINPEVLHAAKERAVQYNYTDVLDRLNREQEIGRSTNYDRGKLVEHEWGKAINPEVVQYDKNRSSNYNLRTSFRSYNKKNVFRPVQDAHWKPSEIDNRTGMNDLHYAVINDDKELVDACLNRRVDINKASQDEYGMRPLHYAILHYHPEMVEHLLRKKADVNAPNLFLHTPLHMIAWLDNDDIAKKIADMLLKNGAKLHAKNKEGNSLLHILVYNNNKPLIEHIGKEYTFDIYAQNDDRESVVDLAKRLNRESLLQNIKKKQLGQ